MQTYTEQDYLEMLRDDSVIISHLHKYVNAQTNIISELRASIRDLENPEITYDKD